MVMADTWLVGRSHSTAGGMFRSFMIRRWSGASRKFPGWRMRRPGDGLPTQSGRGRLKRSGGRRGWWKFGNWLVTEIAISLCCVISCNPPALPPAQGNGQIDWWAVPGHTLTQQMLALGFVERPRSLCVLGKVFDPAKKLGEQLRVESAGSERQRVDIHMDDCHVEIENDAATRMALGRSTASPGHQHGLLTVYPLGKTPIALETLDRALPLCPGLISLRNSYEE